MAASEVVGFAKTGGLADVTGSLPQALARRGDTVAVVMPFYNAVRRADVPVEKTGLAVPVPMGDRVLACRLFRSRLPNSDVPVYLVEHPPFFERGDPPRPLPADDGRRLPGRLPGQRRAVRLLLPGGA